MQFKYIHHYDSSLCVIRSNMLLRYTPQSIVANFPEVHSRTDNNCEHEIWTTPPNKHATPTKWRHYYCGMKHFLKLFSSKNVLELLWKLQQPSKWVKVQGARKFQDIIGILPQPGHHRDKGQNSGTVPAIPGLMATMPKLTWYMLIPQYIENVTASSWSYLVKKCPRRGIYIRGCVSQQKKGGQGNALMSKRWPPILLQSCATPTTSGRNDRIRKTVWVVSTWVDVCVCVCERERGRGGGEGGGGKKGRLTSIAVTDWKA